MRLLCQCPSFDQTNETLRFVQKLIDSFTGEYLDVLESAQYHVVCRHDKCWPKLSDIPEAELEEDEVEDADANDEDSKSEYEEEEERSYQKPGASHATTVKGAAAVAAAGVATVEGAEVAAVASAEAGKVAHRAIAGKAAAEPYVIRQTTVSRMPKGKTALTKRNGTIVDYVSKVVAAKELIEKTHTHGFNHMSTVSQASTYA